MKVLLICLLLATASFTSACGDAGERRHLAPGFTPCGDFLASPGQSVTCHPNQFCKNQTFSTCAVGCLSDYNCSETQVCIKDGNENIGSCQTTDGTE